MQTRLLDQWLADQGFVVVSLDNRGTPGRGHDWERAVREHFGSVPLDDQVAGLRALGGRFPELDLLRGVREVHRCLRCLHLLHGRSASAASREAS